MQAPLTHTPLALTLWAADDRTAVWLRNAALVVLGSLYMAACAQIQVPLWPVPISMQTFGALTVGLALGGRLGGASMLLYVVEGAAGLPVFAGLSGGPAVLMGPTGGYILGFVLAAALTGWLAERGWDRKVWTTALAMLLGNVAIYLPGLPWLAVFYMGGGAADPWSKAIATGLVPFLLGDGLKLALAAAAMPLAWRFVSGLKRG